MVVIIYVFIVLIVTLYGKNKRGISIGVLSINIGPGKG